jgi:excisionase family DNA binding protein
MAHTSIVIDDVEYLLGLARLAGVNPADVTAVKLVLGDGRSVRLEAPALAVRRPDAWLTREEVQQLLRLSRATTEKLLASGELAGVKVGRQWRIPRSAVERFLAPRKPAPRRRR